MELLVRVHISHNSLLRLHTGLCKVIAHVGLPRDPGGLMQCSPPSCMHFCFGGEWRGCLQGVVYTYVCMHALGYERPGQCCEQNTCMLDRSTQRPEALQQCKRECAFEISLSSMVCWMPAHPVGRLLVM